MTPSSELGKPVRRRLLDRRLRQAMAHVRLNLDNPCVSNDLADLVGLSRSRLYALFHDELGTSPMVYWNAMRSEAARERLSKQTDSITTVAMDLGFSTPGNFSRHCKDHLGVTPTAYRRMHCAA
jgi:AraC-like DNA-binding protein